jgi:hypothetical protein
MFKLQSRGVFLLSRVAIGRLGMGGDITRQTRGKGEGDRGDFHRIVCASWLWAFAERPLTVESARPALDRVLVQLAIGSEDAHVSSLKLIFMLHFVALSFWFFDDRWLERIVSETVVSGHGFTRPQVLLRSSDHLRRLIPELLGKFRDAVLSGTAGTEGIGARRHARIDSVNACIRNRAASHLRRKSACIHATLPEPPVSQHMTLNWPYS